ncbi:MAG: hypothetical protein RMX97_02605 [Nostoc sp. DedQUE11]|nr:hypothetical protein [Nostoc sp. DedQUE11]
MPENSLQIKTSTLDNRVIPITRKRENKVSTKFNKPHCIIPVDDIQWIITQTKTVQILWNECWACDQYGSRWIKLTTSLGEKAFRLARQVLYNTGLFEFKRETCTDNTRKTACWLVKNLHGARRIKEFWMKDNDQETAAEIDPISGINEPDIVPKNPNDGQKMPDISAEIPEKSSIPEPLINTSITSQELLKEVPEKKESTTAELLDRVRSYASEKVAQKLKGVFDRCLKRTNSEPAKEDYFKDLFTTRYNWRIDSERLKQILELNQQCQQALMQQFQYTYDTEGMSAPRTFDKAINLVINQRESITEAINRQAEYFQKVWERREQIIGNTPIQV